MKQTKLQLIGTGTCGYNQHRMCSSVYVKLDEGEFIFDFGRGVSHRLMFDLKFEVNDINTIWISHFHPDHISDVIPFFHSLSWSKSGWNSNQNSEKLFRIIGPVGLKDFWDKLLQLYPYPDLIRHELEPRVKIIELEQKTFNIFNTEFELAQLPHANNTAIKFNIGNNKVALGGDCPYSQDEISFIKGTDIAVIDSGHKTDDEIIQTATLSQVGKIILTHVDRNLNDKYLNERAKDKGYKGEIIIGEDLMEIELSCF